MWTNLPASREAGGIRLGDCTEAQVQEVVDAFGKLPENVDEIIDFEWGTDVSTENKADGFTHCFFVTFKNAKGRDIYLPHPAHKEFGKVVRGKLDKYAHWNTPVYPS